MQSITYSNIAPFYFYKIKLNDGASKKTAIIYLTKNVANATTDDTECSAYIGDCLCTTDLCTVYNIHESCNVSADNIVGYIIIPTQAQKVDAKSSYAVLYATPKAAMPSDLNLVLKQQFMSVYTSPKVDFLISCKMSSAMEFILEEQ